MRKFLTVLVLCAAFASPVWATQSFKRSLPTDTIRKGNYTIFNKSATIENLSISKNKKSTEEVLTIRFGYPTVMPTNTIGGAIQTSKQAVDNGVAPEIKNVVILNGKYEDMAVVKDGAKRNKYTLTGLKFPLHLKISNNNEILDFELTEPGKWLIDIELKNN